MIVWLILLVATVLATIGCHAWLAGHRARRSRRSLKHITGIDEWWGKR